MGRTLGDHFTAIAEENGKNAAVIDCRTGQNYTYSELKDRVDLLARGFLSLGIERGDRIGIWSTSSADWITTWMAASEVGAILVNINPAYRTHELEYALCHSGTKVLVVIPRFKTSDYLAMLSSLLCEAPPGKRLPNLEKIVVIDDMNGEEIAKQAKPKGQPDIFTTFERILERGKSVESTKLTERIRTLQFDDPINLQYTSGTTGMPKGVTLSHHNLLNNGILAARAMELDNTVRFCIPMPFYHCGGMISSSLATLSVGGTIVIPGPIFNEEEVLNALQKHKCTHVSGVPTMFMTELEHPRFATFDLSSLRGGFLAGAPCPVQLMRRVASEMHMKDVVILYGLTEVSPLMTSTNVHDSLEVRATTVGRAIPGIEVKIIDPMTSDVLPLGEQGEICSRGHGVMIGYWNNAEATEQTIDKNGWLHSGDLGVMRETGLINITGRKKDMIIRGGENIYPKEVEDALLDHASIAQAQVFGIPDLVLGEDVAAWVLLKQGSATEPEQIKEWLKERISFFKVPKHIKIVTEFPMTVSGKVQKFAMRNEMIQELGLQTANQVQTA